MVEKRKIKRTPEKETPNRFRKAKLMASVALMGTLAACGSREEDGAPGIPNAGGAAGAAGAVEAGATSTGATSSGGSEETGGTAGSTSGSGSGGQAGSRSCPVTPEYDLSCDSLTSVPKTVQVGEQVNLGLENGAMAVTLTEVSGQDFDTAHWEGSNETCDSYSVSVREGESTNLWIANSVINVRVNEVSPDPQTQNTLVNVVFSAVCEDQPGTGGASGSGGSSVGSAGQAGSSAGQAGSSAGQAGSSAGSAGQAGTTETGGASGSGGSSGSAGQTSGGVGGTVATTCEVRSAEVYERIYVNTPFEVGGYTFTYVSSDAETMTLDVSCGGSNVGSVTVPSGREVTIEDSANSTSITVTAHAYNDSGARVTVKVTQN